MLPVLVPLLGVVGIIYFGMLTLVGLIKTVLIMIAGRILLEKKDRRQSQNCKYESESRSEDKNKTVKLPSLKETVRISLQTSKPLIKRIVAITIPTTFIVFILMEIGAFDILAYYLSGVSTYFPIPVEGLTIIAAQFGNFIAANTIASNLLVTGVLTGKEVVITLLVADVLSTIMVTVRWLIPYYLGIFGPRIGTEIMVIAGKVQCIVSTYSRARLKDRIFAIVYFLIDLKAKFLDLLHHQIFVFIIHHERLFHGFNGCPDVFAGIFLACIEILIEYANLPPGINSPDKMDIPCDQG